ncbi:hypothetical protein [Rhodococcus sp. NPDC003348]
MFHVNHRETGGVPEGVETGPWFRAVDERAPAVARSTADAAKRALGEFVACRPVHPQAGRNLWNSVSSMWILRLDPEGWRRRGFPRVVDNMFAELTDRDVTAMNTAGAAS